MSPFGSDDANLAMRDTTELSLLDRAEISVAGAKKGIEQTIPRRSMAQML